MIALEGDVSIHRDDLGVVFEELLSKVIHDGLIEVVPLQSLSRIIALQGESSSKMGGLWSNPVIDAPFGGQGQEYQNADT
jgi:hypothetical protein